MASPYLFENYRRMPIRFTHGRGVRLYDEEGHEYLDFLAGLATSSLGHAHPRLVEAIHEQASRYLHVSNLYEIPKQEEAAEALVKASRRTTKGPVRGLDRVFFCNSGAEANEAVIKLVRRWAFDRHQGDGAPRHEIVVFENGFHGRTLGALAATPTPAYQRGFAPLPAGFVAVPFNDLAALEAAISDRTCAVLVEPIQGEGGVVVGDEDYLRGVQRLCGEHDLLFLLDEVQTGVGRTGEMFAFQGLGLEPDAITLAKGLGGGVPVGAVLAQNDLAQHLVPGTHGTTFGGNPLACSAALTVLSVIESEGLLERVRESGTRLQRGLQSLGEMSGRVLEVRGRGLMWAACLDGSAANLVTACLESRTGSVGLLANAVRPDTVRFLPPLIVSVAEVDEALARLEQELSRLAPGEATPVAAR